MSSKNFWAPSENQDRTATEDNKDQFIKNEMKNDIAKIDQS